jgi:sigma-E factor negative regulatory protein RseC
MADNRMLYHDGIVVGTNDHNVRVKIVSHSACAGCRARGVCTAADMEEKMIEAVSVSNEPLQMGDTVTIIMEEKLGWLSVFYGFFLPFIVMTSVLFMFVALGGNDLEAAFFGIGSLVPYYLLLYLFRKKIEKDFIFKAEKKDKLQDVMR